MINLSLPSLSKDNFVAAYAQVRPYRKGGIRLQHQQINDKHIFHNYGHGGAGVSLSFGTAYISTKSLYTYVDVNRSLDVAVLGCGIIGLLTALQLSKRGHKVQIFAEKIPQYGQKNNFKLTTSQCAPGFWLPYGYDSDSNPLKHQLFSKLSYDYFKDCIKTVRYQSIKNVKVYDKFLDEDIIRESFPQWIGKNNMKKVNINFEQSGIVEQYVYFETIRINLELFLEQLKTQFYMRGGKITEKSFNSLNQVMALNQKYIWNCTGMGSKKIFGDQNMIGIKGHLLQFSNPNPKVYNYFLRSKIEVPQNLETIDQLSKQKQKSIGLKNLKKLVNNICIYTHDKKIIVGLTKQEGQEQAVVNKQIVNMMLTTLYGFLNQRKIKPKL